MATATKDGLYTYMLETLGGEEAALKAFCQTQVVELAKMPISEARAVAKKAGWLDTFDGYTLKELADLIKPATEAKEAAPAKIRHKRRNAKEIEETHQKIVDFLAENPGSPISAIGKHIDESGNWLSVQLKKMRVAEKVTAVGDRASMVYSAA